MERSLRVWSDGAFCCGFKEVFLILVRLQPREVGPSLGSVQLREQNVFNVSKDHWSYRSQLALGEDELEKVSVRDHEDDEEGEGESNLLERLDDPEESETECLKNGEENHPENSMQSYFHRKFYLNVYLTARSWLAGHRTLEGGASPAWSRDSLCQRIGPRSSPRLPCTGRLQRERQKAQASGSGRGERRLRGAPRRWKQSAVGLECRQL